MKRRILLKLSGEVIKGNLASGIQAEALTSLALAIKKIHNSGTELAIVIGGGNLFRGIQGANLGFARAPSDHIGMLATIMNGIALEQALDHVGCPVLLMSALDCPKVASSYRWHDAKRAIAHQVMIFVGGTGNPFFTTDTAAALRANEIGADCLIKATKVDGVYSCDPVKHPESAVFFSRLTYEEVLSKKLEIMDATAIALCQTNQLPIRVVNQKYLTPQTINNILENTSLGTTIQ